MEFSGHYWNSISVWSPGHSHLDVFSFGPLLALLLQIDSLDHFKCHFPRYFFWICVTISIGVMRFSFNFWIYLDCLVKVFSFLNHFWDQWEMTVSRFFFNLSMLLGHVWRFLDQIIPLYANPAEVGGIFQRHNNLWSRREVKPLVPAHVFMTTISTQVWKLPPLDEPAFGWKSRENRNNNNILRKSIALI